MNLDVKRMGAKAGTTLFVCLCRARLWKLSGRTVRFDRSILHLRPFSTPQRRTIQQMETGGDPLAMMSTRKK